VRYLRLLAACLRQKGDEERATEFLHRALLIQPDDPLLNNDVSYAWIDAGSRLDEAEPMIRYALWRRPQEAAYLDTYGWLLYKKGAFAEARKWIQRAERLRGHDPVVFDHLGDICWRLGEKDPAIAYWQQAKKVVAQRVQQNEELNSADERRVRDTVDGKIDDARSGRSPRVADVVQPKAQTE
jgi:Tfp pilus assembly protein PilF